MRVLSLHSIGHDAGVSYFKDGRLAFSIEAERLSRSKHDHRVEQALRHAFAQPQVAADGIDLIAVSSPVKTSLLKIADVDRAMDAVRSGAMHYQTTCDMLDRTVDCVIVTHEVSHAALAAHYAGYSEGCVILVNEGRGQISRSSLFRISGGDMEWLEKDPLPWLGNGFGWSALGYLFGFGKGPSVAGKIMAIGGYGQPTESIREIFEAVDPRVMSDPALAEATRADLAARPEFAGGFDAMANVVATFQQMFTEQVHELLARHTGEPSGLDVALGGGCALNIVANTYLRRRLERDLAIPPASSDSGHPIGAGIYAQKYLYGLEVQPFSVYSNGVSESRDHVADVLSAVGLSPEPYDATTVAREIACGNVVAIVEGRSEIGPRALGHRSLLANPNAPGMRRRLSEELKQREWFRPLGAVMRLERFKQIFPGELPSPFMLFNFAIPKGELVEARHVDGTSRLQTLERCENPRLYDLLQEFEHCTGIPALINTSLNGPGRAIAYKAQDALDDFLGLSVDLFVFGDVMAYATGRAGGAP